MIISTKNIATKEIPKFNEIGFFPTDEYTNSQPFSYTRLVQEIRKAPEVIGILKAIQTDICSDGYTFVGPARKIEAAKKFVEANRFRTEFSACVFDWLLFGNGALWKGKISGSKIKEVAEKAAKITGIDLSEYEIKQLMDEETNPMKSIKCAPWSTMNIEMNKNKTMVKGYHQIISGETPTQFKPSEIIHAKYMTFDGRIYGFSPIESSVNVITTLNLIKDLNGNFFQNGGVPDWMFILAKEMAGSPQVKKLEQTLSKYKQSRQKHGNMVFTGEVNPVQMNKFDKDMEFRQLSVYYTGIIALSFNMPIARVAAVIGSEVKGGAATNDLSEAGYWRTISAHQDYWEELLNFQLWKPEFGVEIRFNRGYRNDEIKEAQRDVQQFEVLNKLAQSGAVGPEYIKFKMDIPDRFWKGKFKPIEAGGFGDKFGSPGSVPNKDKKGDAQQASSERKKEEAKKSTERKELNFIEVDIPEFMSIFEKWVKNSDTQKVDYSMKGDNFNFYVSLPDEKYCTVVGKSQISEVQLNDLLSFGRRIKYAQ